jgi:hypothetical protein
MDKLDQYRHIIRQLLTQKATIKPIGGDIEPETIFDEKADRYLLVHLGWHEQKRIYACILHLEIRDEKIWIQHNQTDQSITEELMENGIPKTDIVLGLQPSYVREYLSA